MEHRGDQCSGGSDRLRRAAVKWWLAASPAQSALNAEGIPSPVAKRGSKTTIRQMLRNETYAGTLLWGVTAKDGLAPVRVEDVFPAVVSTDELRQGAALLRAKAPLQVYPGGRTGGGRRWRWLNAMRSSGAQPVRCHPLALSLVHPPRRPETPFP